MKYIPGLIHIHTNLSYDADVPLKTLKEKFKKKGYKFLCITEHAKEGWNGEKQKKLLKKCKELSDSDFLIIPGLEFACKNGFEILGVGVKKFFTESKIRKTIERIHKEGGLAILPHPNEYKLKIPVESLNGLDGIEIWNLKHDGILSPNVNSIKLLKELQKKNKRVFAFGGLDLHHEIFNEVMIKVKIPNLSEYGILDALKKGNFIITNGKVKISAKCNVSPNRFIIQNLMYKTLSIFVQLWWRLNIYTPKLIKKKFHKIY